MLLPIFVMLSDEVLLWMVTNSLIVLSSPIETLLNVEGSNDKSCGSAPMIDPRPIVFPFPIVTLLQICEWG